jgi:16S rRNA (guanine(966)-N(2))-methyltransferase RsmD
MTMRIGAGELRGRRLHAPKGTATRPTSARLKKSLFDVLVSSCGGLDGAHVLDLFAGAGALGLESLSRGAARAVFVERSRKAVDVLRRNIDELGVADRAEVMAMDVRAALAKLAERGDELQCVFADPPYEADALGGLLTTLGAGELVAEDGLVVVEHHHKRELLETYGSLERFRTLKSGESCFTLFRRVPGPRRGLDFGGDRG